MSRIVRSPLPRPAATAKRDEASIEPDVATGATERQARHVEPVRSVPASVTQTVRDVATQADASYAAGHAAGGDWVENVRLHVRERPARSILMAAGVGILIGLIWR